jgi:hypothetical protein
MKRALTGLGLLAAAGLLVAAAARFPAVVEELYSRGLYPRVSAVLSGLSSLVPLSLAELVVPALSLAVLARILAALRDCRRTSAKRGLGSLGGDLILGTGFLAFTFVLLWGLNYRRSPFSVSAGLDARPGHAAELRELVDELVARANQTREGLPEDARGVVAPPGGTPRILARATAGFNAAADRLPFLSVRAFPPKPLMASEILSRLGLTGIYSPFSGEANVNAAAPLVEIPFSASHEVAHQIGFAREDEANFVGYLACRFHPDPDFNYAGVLGASIHASNALFTVERASWKEAEARRSPAVKRDLQALREWSERYEGPATRAAEKVNDAYLRSQGLPDGVRSYGRMVDLLLAERRAKTASAPARPE